jgi:hypothetical protein
MEESGRDVLVVNRRRLELMQRLLDDPGLRISLITERNYLHLYPGVDKARIALVNSVQNLDEVRRAALQLMGRYDFDAVIAPAESSMPTAAYLRSYFGLPGLSFDVAHAFCNKHVMKTKLRAAGIAVADSRLVPTAESVGPALRAHGLPAVIKPACGDGSANVHIVRDEAALSEIARVDGPLLTSAAYREPPFLVEEFLDVEEEYHCDGLVRDGEVLFAAAFKYLVPPLRSFGRLFGSYTLPKDGAEARELADLHRRAARALGLLDSVTHLEVFRTSRGLVVGEIACRPGGGGVPRALVRAYDFDTWHHFSCTELNKTVQWTPREPDGTYVWVNLPVRLGVVKSVPSPDVFADLPDVEEVEFTVKPGDRVEPPLYSTTKAGVIHCRVATPDDVPALMRDVEERYAVQYEA